jgi:hypothetical protein
MFQTDRAAETASRRVTTRMKEAEGEPCLGHDFTKFVRA